jgi:glycosyltransferase involved in cell wall biosynthesis
LAHMNSDRSSPHWLTVVMPIFNGQRTLVQTLESVLCQQDGLEIIAVDQASSDGSRKVLESFQDRLNIVIIDAPQSLNWMQNTNVGLGAAKTSFCTMLHQDDVWMPGRVAALKDLSERHPDAALWVHDAWFIDKNNRTVGRFGPPFGDSEKLVSQEDVISTLLVQNTLALPAVMFRRDAVLRSGGLDEALWYTADWDLWLRLARIGPLAWLPHRLSGFRLHGSSLTLKGSRNLDDFRNQLTTVFNRHISALPAARAAKIKSLGKASVSMNVALAAAYHHQPADWNGTLLQVLKLGPAGALSLVRDTQILQRVMSRVKTGLKR